MRAVSQTTQGILMMCTASLCFNLNDVFSKVLIDSYEISQIILVRSVIAAPLLVGMALLFSRSRVGWSSKVPFHALRGLINLAAACLYIYGLRYLSVAEATVILFSSPLLVTLASSIVFKERVTLDKWAAGICSFVGVIVAIRPGAETFQVSSLFILGASVLYAVNSVTARWIPERDNLWTVSFFGAAFSALFVSPSAVSGWTPLSAGDLAYFTGAALCSSLGIGLSSLAYRLALAADLNPFAYSGLIWSLALTWIVWGTGPSLWTVVGALMIVASSVFYWLPTGRRRATGDTD